MVGENATGYEYAAETCSLMGGLIRKLLGFVFHVFRKSLIRRGRNYSQFSLRRCKAPKGFTIEKPDIGGFYAELLTPEKPSDGKIILLLHGGAYVTGYNNYYRRMGAVYSRLSGNVRVLAIDYRLGPENPYPAALEDTLKAYGWLIEQGYQHDKIIILGDSAGGGLSLAAAMALRDRGDPVPAALVLLSPWTDLAAKGKSRKEKYEVDPMLGRKTSGLGISALAYTTEDNFENPYVSPAYGRYEGMPPMLIHAGECEILLSDSETVAAKARESGVPVEFKVWKGMFHVFQMFYVIIPEAKRSVELICRFMKEKFD